MNRLTDALIRSAAANISLHAFVNVLIGGRRLLFEQRRSLHNLATLAVATLRHVDLFPSPLDGVIAVGAQSFDGKHIFAGGRAHLCDATALRRAVYMNCARAAQANSTAELGSGESQEVAKIPQQRHLRVAVILPRRAIYG